MTSLNETRARVIVGERGQRSGDKAWADEHFPKIETYIRAIMGEVAVIRSAIPSDDMKHGRDYDVGGFTVAARLRDAHTTRGTRDLTIRSRKVSGARTERQKILDGDHADWYICGWLDGDVVLDVIWVNCGLLRARGDLGNKTRWKELLAPDGVKFIPVPVHDLMDMGALRAWWYRGHRVARDLLEDPDYPLYPGTMREIMAQYHRLVRQAA